MTYYFNYFKLFTLFCDVHRVVFSFVLIEIKKPLSPYKTNNFISVEVTKQYKVRTSETVLSTETTSLKIV